MAYITERLSAESRKFWEECLRKAVPYSQEEMDDLPFDDKPDEESRNRQMAYRAQKFLAEDDALRASENK